MASSSNLIDIRMKLSGGRAVVSGLSGTRKETEKLGSATHKTSRITSAAAGTTSRLTGAYKQLSSHAKLALGALGIGGVMAIENSIHATEELSKTTTGLSRNLGLQVNVASRWGALAQAREIDTKSLNMSFGTLSTKMVEAGRKGGSLLTPFHQLGISQKEVAKGATNFQWGLMRVAKALGEEEGGAKRSTAAKAVLGKGYQSLLPLFSEGTEGLKEQLHWADEYGVTLSGKTNEGIMDMVQAQRENKVAMLGLKVSLTTALMPAIKAGDEELQTFIKTLNSPNLSAEQKVEKIGEQFQGLETEIVKVIERALPTVAEHAGQLGIQMAGAVVNGFVHSNLLGKLAIAGYVFNLFGGASLAKAGALKVGGKLGTEFGIGLATGAIGAFVAYEIWSHLSKKEQQAAERWGVHMGENFVNGLINIVNHGIEEINNTMDEANFLSAIGVEAPNIGTIGEVRFGMNPNEPPGATKHSKGEAPSAFQPGLHGTFIPGGPEVKPHPHHRHAGSTPRLQSAPHRQTAFWDGGENHFHLYVDGKPVAHAVLKAGQDRAALK